MLRMLLNGGGTPLQIMVQFGTHGYQARVMREHLSYLNELEATVRPVSNAFWPEGVCRWKTMNDILRLRYQPPAALSRRLRYEAEAVAALVGFPLLEEIARRVTNAWDEDGVLNVDIPKTAGLFRVTSKGKREPKTYKSGDRIVDLSHKLILLKNSLDPNLQKTIENIDERLSQSPLDGVEYPLVTFFERLEMFRNLVSHGRRFEGIEAWLITLFIAMLYFWLPQSDEEKRLERIWQDGGADGNLPFIEVKPQTK